jgi:anti-anti-sigma factor
VGRRHRRKKQLCSAGHTARQGFIGNTGIASNSQTAEAGEKTENTIVQSETKSRVDQLTSPAGQPVTVLRFEGDIASTSKEAVLGAYQALPKNAVKIILLDFTKVDYINSSGIALVIQLLIEAAGAGQKVYAFGLSAHFVKVFTMVGITKYAGLFPTQAEALAGL